MNLETNKKLPKGWKTFYISLLSVLGILRYQLMINDLELFIPVLIILFSITEKKYKKINNSRDVKWSDVIPFLPKRSK